MLHYKLPAQDTLPTSGQLKEIMNEKKNRTAIEQKISSRLSQAIREMKSAAKKNLQVIEPVNVNADKEGNLKVDIKADVTDLLTERIKNIGAQIIFSSKEYHSIRARINLSMVEKIAAYPEVKFVEPASIPILNR